MSVWKLADAESVAHSVAESSIPSLDVYEDPMHPFGGWGRGLGGVQPHGSSHHKGSKFTKRGFEYAVPETRGKVKPTTAPRAAARGGSSHCSNTRSTAVRKLDERTRLASRTLQQTPRHHGAGAHSRINLAD